MYNWKSVKPYMVPLKSAVRKGGRVEEYLEICQNFDAEPATFLMDLSTLLLSIDRNEAICVLSSIVELDFGNPIYLRGLAYICEQLNLIDYAINLYERIWKSR